MLSEILKENLRDMTPYWWVHCQISEANRYKYFQCMQEKNEKIGGSSEMLVPTYQVIRCLTWLGARSFKRK
jgi:hypothetical protein